MGRNPISVVARRFDSERTAGVTPTAASCFSNASPLNGMNTGVRNSTRRSSGSVAGGTVTIFR